MSARSSRKPPRTAKRTTTRTETASAAESPAFADWSGGLRIWVERNGQAVLGEGRADLLAAVDRTHSISAAARELKMSYRHAWLMIQAVNEAAAEPLVESAVGGIHGGGAKLSDRGRAALRMFRDFSANVRRHAAADLSRLVRAEAKAESTLRVAAAISLQEAVGQILTEYALVRPQVRVHSMFGASNELAAQISDGAAADIFITGDARLLDGLLPARTRTSAKVRKLAANGLAGVALQSSSLVARRADRVLRGDYAKIAVAAPATPLGQATRRFLMSRSGATIAPDRVIEIDNSRGILAAVRSGRADLGIAFSSDAATAGDMRTLFQVSPRQIDVAYSAAVLTPASQSRLADEAQALLEFFLGPVAQRCLRRCGLRV